MPGFGSLGEFGIGEIDSPGGGGASTSPATSFKKNSPGCGCCCACDDVCGGDTPCRWTLAFDGQEIVASRLVNAASNGQWYGSFATITYLGCDYNRVLFYNNAASGDKLLVQLYHSTGTQAIEWRSASSVGRPFDCEDAYTLAYLSNSGACTPSGTPGSMTATPSRFVECANGDSSVDCGHCIEGTAPPRFKVVLSGMGTASGLSPTCAAADGTYYCDYSGTSTDGCVWQLDTGAAICASNVRYMRVVVGPANSPGHRSIAVWFTTALNGVSGYEWYENTCATPCDVADCGIFNNTLLDDFSPESVSGGCRVTAIF